MPYENSFRILRVVYGHLSNEIKTYFSLKLIFIHFILNFLFDKLLLSCTINVWCLAIINNTAFITGSCDKTI
ncbi:hypothetical protein BpHYR1_009744 [Brachionus plicatilis]|uniref:Uncharacterized protein n=1 Tax=Brachionus plicatilis TaxID=10195 RepID=A0A3M7QZZ9_BRAPC|nr:hypothetical protein BpHYR1_009744 [Brachionus plicatilis]